MFVREEYTVRSADFATGQSPGSKVNKGVIFREPGYVAFPFGIFCPLIAIARGALDCFTDFAKTRAQSAVRDPMLQLLNTQRSIGEAAAEIDAAYLLAKDNDAKLMAGLPNGEADAMAIRRNFTLASRLAMRGVDRLFEASGARGILESNPIQRFWRDVHAAGNHVAWGVDTGYVNAGAFAMGMPPVGAQGVPPRDSH